MNSSEYKQALISGIEEVIDEQEAYLDSFIDSGSEQELFVASYIHGHFSVVVAGFLSSLGQLSAGSLDNINVSDVKADFLLKLNHSITEAINNEELIGEDANQVQSMLSSLAKI